MQGATLSTPSGTDTAEQPIGNSVQEAGCDKDACRDPSGLVEIDDVAECTTESALQSAPEREEANAKPTMDVKEADAPADNRKTASRIDNRAHRRLVLRPINLTASTWLLGFLWTAMGILAFTISAGHALVFIVPGVALLWRRTWAPWVIAGESLLGATATTGDKAGLVRGTPDMVFYLLLWCGCALISIVAIFRMCAAATDAAPRKTPRTETPVTITWGILLLAAYVASLSSTWLQYAIQRKDASAVSRLTAFGLNVNCRLNYQGLTPLYEAARIGDKATVSLLIGKGADVNSTYTTTRSDFIAGLAERLGIDSQLPVSQMEEKLRDKGWTGQELDTSGLNMDAHPLFIAIDRQNKDAALLLIKAGANVNARNSADLTALHAASFRRWGAGVAALINAGADVNAKDAYGRTALHYAALSDCPEIAELLAEHGANIEAADNDGLTPLEYANRGDFSEVARCLRKHGAGRLVR